MNSSCHPGISRTCLSIAQSPLSSASTPLGRVLPLQRRRQLSVESHGLPSCLWVGILPSSSARKLHCRIRNTLSWLSNLTCSSFGQAMSGNLKSGTHSADIVRISNECSRLLLKGAPSCHSDNASDGSPGKTFRSCRLTSGLSMTRSFCAANNSSGSCTRPMV